MGEANTFLVREVVAFAKSNAPPVKGVSFLSLSVVTAAPGVEAEQRIAKLMPLEVAGNL